jgi:hypothetical protein
VDAGCDQVFSVRSELAIDFVVPEIFPAHSKPIVNNGGHLCARGGVMDIDGGLHLSSLKFDSLSDGKELSVWRDRNAIIPIQVKSGHGRAILALEDANVVIFLISNEKGVHDSSGNPSPIRREGKKTYSSHFWLDLSRPDHTQIVRSAANNRVAGEVNQNAAVGGNEESGAFLIGARRGALHGEACGRPPYSPAAPRELALFVLGPEHTPRQPDATGSEQNNSLWGRRLETMTSVP